MRKPALIIGSLLLAACAGEPEMDTIPTGEAVPNAGEQAYMTHCAGCHETGLLEAPVVGERADWEERSKLWQAVVMQHARTGYLDMPARGGRPDLPDDTIDAAVEYMLRITFPDMPPDQPQ